MVYISKFFFEQRTICNVVGRMGTFVPMPENFPYDLMGLTHFLKQKS